MNSKRKHHGIDRDMTPQGERGFARLRTAEACIVSAQQGAAERADRSQLLPLTVAARHWHVPSTYGLIHQDHDMRLWLALADGRVLVFRIHGQHEPDDLLVAPIAAAVADDLRGMLVEFDLAGDVPVSLLYAAPAEPPAPRCPHDEPAAARADRVALASRLDMDVLQMLGKIERADHEPVFYRSVRNYNRLLTLPSEQRLRRMQALARFPGLIVPLLLTAHHACNLHDGRRHAMRRPAPEVEAAIDGGRDLIGALAHEYGISRSLVRSPLNAGWWAMADTNRRTLLRMFDAVPAPRRPRDPAQVVRHWHTLAALIRLLGHAGDDPVPLCARVLAGAFRRGVSETLEALAAQHANPANVVHDAVDFLAAAARRADVHLSGHGAVSWRRLGETWLTRYGLLALVDASIAWHQQPAPPGPSTASRAEPGFALVPIIGRLQADDAIAEELLHEHDLVVEGVEMHHCVAEYWWRCIRGDRIIKLIACGDERATAHLRPLQAEDGRRYELAQLRGRCNEDASAAMHTWADAVVAAINAPERLGQRIAACARGGAQGSNAGDVGARARQPAHDEDFHAPPVPPLRRHDEARMLRCLARMGYSLHQPERLLLTTIAGWTHHCSRVEEDVRVGDALALVRDPTNPHDARAVRIERSGTLLGFIPRHVNANIAEKLDRGVALSVRVERVDPYVPAWERVRVEISRRV